MAKFIVFVPFFLIFASLVGWLVFVLIGAFRAERRERESPTVFNPNRAYINWRPRDGWPRGPFLNYECALCGASVGSKQTRETQCKCGNVFVGPGQIGAKDETKIRLYEEKLDGSV